MKTKHVTAGVALQAGEAFFGQFRPEPARGATIFSEKSSVWRTLRTTETPRGTPWHAAHLVVDTERVYWTDSWWTYEGENQTVLRSIRR